MCTSAECHTKQYVDFFQNAFFTLHSYTNQESRTLFFPLFNFIKFYEKRIGLDLF